MAGVLHRDVSVGNILIVDRPEPNAFRGFIHDFDCSSMTDAPPMRRKKSSDEEVALETLKTAEEGSRAARMERTVSTIAARARLPLSSDSMRSPGHVLLHGYRAPHTGVYPARIAPRPAVNLLGPALGHPTPHRPQPRPEVLHSSNPGTTLRREVASSDGSALTSCLSRCRSGS